MKPHPRILPLLSIAVLALGLSACGKATQVKNPFAAPGSQARDGSVRVSVENQNFGDATIHVVRGGERVRLGNVTGKSDKQFNVRWSFSLPLEFEVHIIGGSDCRVRPLSVDPGDRVWLRIPTQVPQQPCYSGKGG